MLSKKFRLATKEIPLVLKSGKRQNYKFFNISYIPSGHPQITVVVSNKIDNRAAHRNKIKRRLTEAIQKSASWRTAKFQNKKIIIFAKKEILNAKFSDILSEVNKIAS